MSQLSNDSSIDLLDDLATADWGDFDELDKAISPHKPWRSPEVENSPSTPSKEGTGTGLIKFRTPPNRTPATPSRPPRGKASASKISRTSTNSDEEIDDKLPQFKRLSFTKDSEAGGQRANANADDDGANGDEVQQSSFIYSVPPPRRSTFSAMDPPPIPRRPPPLRASETQTSIGSTSSSDTLFSPVSRTSSATSVGSMSAGRISPLKRGAATQSVSPTSPAPSKCRRLNETQNASESSVRPSKASSSPDISFSLGSLFGGRHGTALPTHIIAHSTEAQKLYDTLGVALGVQWELTRSVSTGRWTWEDIITRMKALTKTEIELYRINSQVAWQIPDLMRGRTVGQSRDLALWNEVDREHKAMKEGISRGLGLLDEYWEGQTNYYGGRIEYPLRLKKTDDPDRPYEVFMEKPRKGRSFRFARDLGSSSILHLSIPSLLVREEGDNIRNFLAQRFIINGRVYVPIPPKDTSSVYLIQTDQNYERVQESMGWYGDRRRLSFDEFLQRHNPPEPNSQQSFAKYTARFALGLSTSIPVLEFAKNNIVYIDDTVAEGWDGEGKPPTEKIMTDGCGFMNHSALLLIKKSVGYDRLPTAVQGRIGGAKGLWTLHPHDMDETPKIWIRHSQLKIILSSDHRVHRIFDLLRASCPSPTETHERLSEQSIQCLSHNGTPPEVLSSLLVEGLEANIKPLLDWAPGAMVSLWRAIDRVGSVGGTRVQRIAGAKSRVLGYRDREPDEVEGQPEVEDIDTSATISSRSGRDQVGGPRSLHEQAMELIQAGFHPATCDYLNWKLRYIVDNEINTVVEKYRISLPESTASEALVIPDPLGRLKPNQIYYRSSNPMKNSTTQTLFHVLEGDVIVGRYPMRLPCDLQKVTAVDIPELSKWSDVIIAPTAGEHSLLSLLSGGDYDGDTVVFIWLEAFCKNFGDNRPLTPAPKDLMLNFHQEVKTVEQVGHELGGLSLADSQQAFQGYLLKGLRDSQVGLYSYFHDNAIWRHGYGHRESILMAYIGNTLLDAGKTGLTLKEEEFKKHQKAFGHARPKTNDWKGPGRPAKKSILQILFEVGKSKRDELLRRYDLASGRLPETFKAFEADADLLEPYKLMQAKSDAAAEWSVFLKSELKKVERHVRDIYDMYKEIFPLEKEQKALRAAIVLSVQGKFAERIPDVHLIDGVQLEQVKASYAYSLKDDFGFTVAFAALCKIKAEAGPGGMAPSLRLFDELKSISSSASQALDEDYDVD
ncbi:RNA dependent RNA polymerase-domain-containing protein [Mycena sanguinolenta]|nr:RNA dependent RNA polymerase-domain-containing protein [Mycena sanguinolenta]